jgi:hypothetical protein
VRVAGAGLASAPAPIVKYMSGGQWQTAPTA